MSAHDLKKNAEIKLRTDIYEVLRLDFTYCSATDWSAVYAAASH